MLPLSKKSNIWQILAMLTLFMFTVIPVSGETLVPEIVDTKRLEMVSGKSMILRSKLPVKRVSIADPEIADLVLISANEIYLKGKAAGVTNLTLWQNKSVVAIYDLEVVYDLSRLKQQLHDLLPDEHDLRVVSSNDFITLSGKISNASNLSQALGLAKAYAPEEKINNLVQVGGVHQVMDVVGHGTRRRPELCQACW